MAAVASSSANPTHLNDYGNIRLHNLNLAPISRAPKMQHHPAKRSNTGDLTIAHHCVCVRCVSAGLCVACLSGRWCGRLSGRLSVRLRCLPACLSVATANLPLSMSVCVSGQSVCLCLRIWFCLCHCLGRCLCRWLCLCLPVCLSARLSVCLPVCPSICLLLFVWLAGRLSVNLSVRPPAKLSVCISGCLSVGRSL